MHETDATMIARFSGVQDRLEMLGWSVCIENAVFRVHKSDKSPDEAALALSSVTELLAFCAGLEAQSIS